jgi:MFS family permease
MVAPASPDSQSDPQTPGVLPPLVAMTALQMLISATLVAPGVLAPRLGIDPSLLGFYATAACIVATMTTFVGGMLAGRFGSFRVATFCALIALCAAGVAAIAGASPLLVVAGIILGCAYGPETPASSAVLWRITPIAARPLVFSVRQTGNQIGMMTVSLTLPWIAESHPGYGYAAIMIAAVIAIAAFESLRPTYDPLVRGTASSIRLRDALTMLIANAEIRKLAIASLPFSALQIALNIFLVTYGVTRLGLDLVAAGLLLATAQAGGLLGRLGFGVIAGRWLPAWTTVVGLGFGMSFCAAVMAIAAPGWSWPLLLVVAFLFGVTASGWNGVFLSEVARLAPDGRVAEATGAVLMFGFAGLVVGPLVMAGIAAMSSLGVAFAVIGLTTLVATLMLVGRSR